MNVDAEIKALGIVICRVQKQADRGEVASEDRAKIADYLQGRLALVKRHIATDEFVEFQKIIETPYTPRDAPRGAG